MLIYQFKANFIIIKCKWMDSIHLKLTPIEVLPGRPASSLVVGTGRSQEILEHANYFIFIQLYCFCICNN